MAPPPLHVIALISGGKDSFYAHLHTLRLGHTVVALANLYPPPPPPSPSPSDNNNNNSNDNANLPPTTSPSPASFPPDLNSHMYQTAGHALIPHYAAALGVPLYRGLITGGAVQRAREYEYIPPHPLPHPPPSSTTVSGQDAPSPSPAEAEAHADAESDETEALIPLLRRIKAAHPSANALVSGAILSTYQRTRVESVCLRLGLIPLAWLWQYPSLPCPVPAPGSLLEDIAAAGLEARLVKVAGGGLDEGFLWESLGEKRGRERVERALGRFGGSVIGEGGEFESLVVAGPKGVWKGKLVVKEEERVVGGGEGGEWWLGFKGGRVEMVEGGEEEKDREAWKSRVRVPGFWDLKFGELADALRWMPTVFEPEASAEVERAPWEARPVVNRNGSSLRISNLAHSKVDADVKEQTKSICSILRSLLSDHKLTPDDMVFTTILLRSMADFPVINAIYGELFKKPNPPARATVSCGSSLPEGCDIVLSAVADLGPRDARSGLHVQSRSYWAPANIGPYSQAIILPERFEGDPKVTFVAGQIPLVPSTMEDMTDADLESETKKGTAFIYKALLSAQHLWRIGAATGVSWWTGAVAFIAYRPEYNKSATMRANTAWGIWAELHKRPVRMEDVNLSDETEPDIWLRVNGGWGSWVHPDDDNRGIPDYDRLKSSPAGLDYITPGFFAVEVDELPRGCSIEWLACGFGFGGKSEGGVTIHQDSKEARGIKSYCGAANATEGETRNVTFIECETRTDAERWAKVKLGQQGQHPMKSTSLIGQRDKTQATVYTAVPDLFHNTNAQIIPCRRVWGKDAKEIKAGIVLWEEL